ncbi:hypothetical protein DICVIV_11938 [Dictyocaulus viviparus]|uniref:Uncharacterized protein n=1 Tax=Dictyocaulus viviparus TaxID=29172 RepID=A0A0D8XBT2_DICVI|nr:hypothetical protein DICVIV_11938 [Dictyocaulus viviparus]
MHGLEEKKVREGTSGKYICPPLPNQINPILIDGHQTVRSLAFMNFSYRMIRYLVLAAIALTVSFAYPATGGLDVDNLSANGKKFFMDMTKQVMGVPSLKPENLAAQSFFRSFLDKYTKLDEKTKKDMEQHVPTATKIFNEAAQKYNVDPHKAFQMLSTFFENFKKGEKRRAEPRCPEDDYRHSCHNEHIQPRKRGR